jgi:hypothetical protein
MIMIGAATSPAFGELPSTQPKMSIAGHASSQDTRGGWLASGTVTLARAL